MRLRDTFKYFCPVCWICFCLFTAVWLFMAFICVITFGYPPIVASIIYAAMLVGLAGLLVWVSVSEAKSHYLDKRCNSRSYL